ncbi:hypothetical protein HYQ46_006843 [Verticillium longisporum]|nr:hypothetical protein HYQ46_006843 [Verticillium longisporum]
MTYMVGFLFYFFFAHSINLRERVRCVTQDSAVHHNRHTSRGNEQNPNARVKSYWRVARSSDSEKLTSGRSEATASAGVWCGCCSPRSEASYCCSAGAACSPPSCCSSARAASAWAWAAAALAP